MITTNPPPVNNINFVHVASPHYHGKPVVSIVIRGGMCYDVYEGKGGPNTTTVAISIHFFRKTDETMTSSDKDNFRRLFSEILVCGGGERGEVSIDFICSYWFREENFDSQLEMSRRIEDFLNRVYNTGFFATVRFSDFTLKFSELITTPHNLVSSETINKVHDFTIKARFTDLALSVPTTGMMDVDILKSIVMGANGDGTFLLKCMPKTRRITKTHEGGKIIMEAKLIEQSMMEWFPLLIRFSEEGDNKAFVFFGAHFCELSKINGINTPQNINRIGSLVSDAYGGPQSEQYRFFEEQLSSLENREEINDFLTTEVIGLMMSALPSSS